MAASRCPSFSFSMIASVCNSSIFNFTFSQKSAINDGKATVKFEDLPEGDYALVVMHDENSNGRMDFETNGMPTESYATSGESKFMGQPMWSDTKFKLDDSTKKLSLRF